MKNNMTVKPEYKASLVFVFTLGILSMLPPLGIDMYLPSFLNIAQDLAITVEQVQFTLTFFTYGMATGQLFWGPVGDSFGRKPIILLGVSVGATVALILTQINSIENFTALRFVQGFFGAAPVVLVGALLRDLFDKNELSRMMSMITLVFMVAPLLAPIIGGQIIKYWHWHTIFYVIGAMGILSLSLVFFIIPETHKKENRIPLHLNIIVRNFVTLWKQKEVLGYMFSSGLGFGGLFAFITSGSIVYIGLYGIKPENFGFFFMLNIGIMTLGSILNGRFVRKIGAERMMQIGLCIQFISGIWLVLTALFDLGFWCMAIGVAVFVGQNSFISSNAMASILGQFPTIAGTANSVAGSVRFGIGASVGSLVALMKMDSAAPMLYTMSACSLGAVCCYYFLTYRTINR
ncbi:MAG: Bcr/CflA family multidrug efflux MFS transporter [[Actinobacillus] rossii]|uniref:Bcr/CflA family efflux transporter n=1 Tax=[Actinobacillus] rossii TaxID=123820 RepID=A0A380TNW4_9PAST|nr:Bcr/CflA family multidrug efflux MFS transporter [[Actinobacillus] rossii]MDY4504951.1 Bcr/CflA family multidrug efflux MFS transporter [[Actinobacillus] rossii]SUT89263.1 bicyclomycin/multidrug efflux system [[Actinobacillus] rossii]